MKIFVKQLMALALCAGLGGPALAQASNYLVVVPLPGKPVVVPEIGVELVVGELKPGKVGKSYAEDLKPYLKITGDDKFNYSDVVWNVYSGSLPTGLTLNPDGSITGKPSKVTDGLGAVFGVQATFKDKAGDQMYYIVIGENIAEATKVATGDSVSCLVTPAGAAQCWGDNSNGRLGTGDKTLLRSNVPLTVAGLGTGVKDIKAGEQFFCALTTAGGVKCWGYNVYGQLGNGSNSYSHLPVDVVGLSPGIQSLEVGGSHACAIPSSGPIQCWGYNSSGQVGDGTNVSKNTAVPIALDAADVESLALGADHSCAVLKNNTATCWGSNSYGQLGDGGMQRSKPMERTPMTDITKLAAGNGHTCAITSAGGVKCTGYNTAGQLGNNSVAGSMGFVQVSGLTSGVTDVSAGLLFTCAKASTGLRCWGRGTSAQLGNGGTADSRVPVAVTDSNANWTLGAISAKSGHACATSGAAVKCWGVWNSTLYKIPTAIQGD